MLKEFSINRGIDFAAWRAKNGEYPLSPTGKKHWKRFIGLVKKRVPINLSEHINILDGYDYTSHVKGLESLTELDTDKGCLIVSNHNRALPLKGDSITLSIGFHVKEKTGKEIRWIYGSRSSPNQAGKENYEASLKAILVEGKNTHRGGKILIKAIGKDFIGLYPEGDNSDELLKAKLDAGGVISRAAKKGVPVICVSTYLKNKAFHVAFEKLDGKQILTLRAANLSSLQNIADYTMAKIAMHLPEEKRGYYSNPQEHIDAFQSQAATN